MARQTPPWLGSIAAVDDRERYAAMTPEERLRGFVEVVALIDALDSIEPLTW